jgi:threonylcarbamoyladenosine tRNA methylthiotransferase MtaB
MLRPSVSFYTFGCRLNQAETATLSASFRNNGYDIVDFGEAPADVVVVNTCTVTQNGDADTRKLVNRIAREQPAAGVALVGCQAQLQQEQLTALPNVRWVVGNARKLDLVSLIEEQAADTDAALVECGPMSREAFTMPAAGVDRVHTRANLKIQDGCDFYCLFCTIPYARGRARSRLLDDLLAEAVTLTAAGHRELVLTGVNIGTYADSGATFLGAVERLLATPQLERLRISSIEPTTIPEALLPLIAATPQLCAHLHIPLQSGCDSVLYRMNRRYTCAEYREFLLRADQQVPGVCLGTDVIVGYPGETDADFDETVAFIEALPFAYLHVFSYSEREQAASRKLPDPVPRRTVAQRSRVLRELSSTKREAYHARFLEQTLPVLFERCRDGWWDGLTDNYIRVRVRAGRDLTNVVAPVTLERSDGALVSGSLA